MLLSGIIGCLVSMAFCYSGWQLRRKIAPVLAVTIIGTGFLFTLCALLFLIIVFFFGVNT